MTTVISLNKRTTDLVSWVGKSIINTVLFAHCYYCCCCSAAVA